MAMVRWFMCVFLQMRLITLIIDKKWCVLFLLCSSYELPFFRYLWERWEDRGLLHGRSDWMIMTWIFRFGNIDVWRWKKNVSGKFL